MTGEHTVPGFQELLVIGLVAAVVIGPDKLPKLAADVARLLARIRREAGGAVGEVKSHGLDDGLTDLRHLHRELRDTRGLAARAVRNEFRTLTEVVGSPGPNHRPAPAARQDRTDTADRASAGQE